MQLFLKLLYKESIQIFILILLKKKIFKSFKRFFAVFTYKLGKKLLIIYLSSY